MHYSKAELHLMKHDEVMGQIIRSNPPVNFKIEQEDPFESLVRSIISQQISVGAAKSIFAKLTKETALKPENLIEINDEKMRKIGLSGRKRQYLQNLAFTYLTDPGLFTMMSELDDQAVTDYLTKIKGIGIWTAQMFLIFTLGRPDVFAPDDHGLKKAIQNNYHIDPQDRSAQLALSKIWSPYRSTACLHSWTSLRNN